MGNPAVYPNEGRDIFVADVLAYAAFPRFHLLAPLGDSIYRRITGNEWESTVYLGFVNLGVLAAAGLRGPPPERSADNLCPGRNGDVLHNCKR